MSKMRPSKLAVLLAAVMLLGLLAACGQSQQPSATPSKSPSTAGSTVPSNEPAETLDPVTLRFYFIGDKKASFDEVWNYIGEITKDRLNAKFEVTFIPYGDYNDKIKAMAASGDNYDMNWDNTGSIYPAMTNNGAYLGLNELLPKYAPQMYASYVEKGLIDSCKVNGEIMAMPWTFDKSSRPALLWRGDLLEQFGIPAPTIKTIEDVEAFLYQIKDADTGLYPLYFMSPNSAVSIISVMLAPKYQYNPGTFGGLPNISFSWDDPSCKLIPFEQTELFREAAMYAKKWVDDGIIPKDAISNPNSNPFRDELCIAMPGTWSLSVNSYITNYTATATKEFAIMYPDKNYPLDSPLGNIMCVNKNAANPERSIMFMELLSTDQAVYDAVNYGIEGKTYVLDDNGVVAFPEGMDLSTSNYMEWEAWALYRIDMKRPNPTYSVSYWEKYDAFFNSPTQVNWPLSGFMMNTDPIKNEITTREAIRQELGMLIEYGLVDDVDKAIEEYIQKQKEAGADKLVAEMQKQVDAFLASK